MPGYRTVYMYSYKYRHIVIRATETVRFSKRFIVNTVDNLRLQATIHSNMNTTCGSGTNQVQYRQLTSLALCTTGYPTRAVACTKKIRIMVNPVIQKPKLRTNKLTFFSPLLAIAFPPLAIILRFNNGLNFEISPHSFRVIRRAHGLRVQMRGRTC